MSNDMNVDQELNGEGGGSNGFDTTRRPFSGKGSSANPGTKGFIALMLLCGVGMGAFFVYQNVHSHHRAVKQKEEMFANNLPKHNFVAGPDDTPFNAGAAPVPGPAAPPAAPGPSQDALGMPNQPRTDRNGKKIKTPQELAQERRLHGDFDNDAESGGGSSSGGSGPAQHAQTDEGSQGLARRLTPAAMMPNKAAVMKHQDLTVARGTMISCGTLTEIDSSQPGFVSCRVSRDVWSMNGKARLIDKGAFVDGQVANAMRFGQKRVFVTWVRLRNPDGVVVDLDSEGTNNLGSSGIPGSVNNHFWDRFGDAILISIITDLGQTMVQAVTNLASKTGTTSINMDNTESSGNQLGREALQATINIPPSLYVQQGQAVSIYVARDLDFSNVYHLTDE